RSAIRQRMWLTTCASNYEPNSNRRVYPRAHRKPEHQNQLVERRLLMTSRDLVQRSLSVLLLCACSLPAMAQGVGAIGGTIADSSGAVLPGATVTLSNPLGSIGGNQSAVTDDRGAFQFLRLVPGTYTVKADLQGFRPAVQTDVVVNADATARVDLKLEIGTLEEGVTVKGESPLLDTTSALRQTV